MKINSLILFLLVLLLNSCGYYYEQSEFYLQKGLRYFHQAEIEKASDMFDKCLKEDPQNPSAILYKVRAMSILNDTTGAYDLISRGLAIDSLSPSIISAMGMYLLISGETGSSINFLKKACELDTAKDWHYYNLGMAFLAYDENDSAKIFLDKAIEVDPNYSHFYLGRGNYFYQIKDYPHALEDFSKGLSYSDNKIDKYYAYFSLGLLSRDMKEYGKSIHYFSMAIKSFPNFSMNYYYRGLSYSAIKEYDKALEDFRKAKILGDKDVDNLIKECQFLKKTGA